MAKHGKAKRSCVCVGTAPGNGGTWRELGLCISGSVAASGLLAQYQGQIFNMGRFFLLLGCFRAIVSEMGCLRLFLTAGKIMLGIIPNIGIGFGEFCSEGVTWTLHHKSFIDGSYLASFSTERFILDWV